MTDMIKADPEDAVFVYNVDDDVMRVTILMSLDRPVSIDLDRTEAIDLAALILEVAGELNEST